MWGCLSGREVTDAPSGRFPLNPKEDQVPSTSRLALTGTVVGLLLGLSALALCGGLAAVVETVRGQEPFLAFEAWWALTILFAALAFLGACAYAYRGEEWGLWTVANPFQKQVCPVCFRDLHVSDCRIVSAFDRATVIEQAPRGLRKLRNRILIPALAGERYAQDRAQRECPFCSNLLPYNLEYADNRIIALVGGAASGKSLYLASLIKQLENERLREKIGCIQFRALDDENEQTYQEQYYAPLYEKHLPIGRSPVPEAGQFARPLTYLMILQRRKRTRQVNLIFYDIRGENTQDQAALAHSIRPVPHASAIIFMVDPMAFPRLPRLLPHHLRPDADQRSEDPAKLLASVTREIQKVRRVIHGAGTLDIPMAITLTKSDLFHWIDPRGTPAFLSDPTSDDGTRGADRQTVDGEVRRLIEQYDGPAISQSAELYSARAYFAVSATGSPEQRGGFAAVCPHRTAEPLLWALSRLGIVDY